MGVRKYPGETITVTATVEYRGAAGAFAFEFALTAKGSTVVANGRQTFTTPLSASWVSKSVAATVVTPNSPTGDYVLHAAIWATDASGKSIGSKEILYVGYDAAVTIINATEFQKFGASVG